MKITVVGGGVGGAACAIGLRRLGAEVTVYEANPDPAGSVGSFLSLPSNGLRGLGELGCLEPVRRAGFEVPRQRLWSSSGKLLGDVPRGRLCSDPENSITLMRGHLVDRLRAEAGSAGARIVTNRRLIDASVTDRGVRAQFDDGLTDTSDLLIGADGIWSVTRRILDVEAPKPDYAGLYTVAGTANGEGIAVEPGSFNLVFARPGAFLYVAADDGSIWWAAQVASPREPELLSPDAEPVASLAELFRHEATPSAILRAVTSTHRPTLHHLLAAVPVWHSDRIVLVGDAAHPVGAGQGASMAIEDAVVLARRLGAQPSTSPSSISAALAGYAQARRTRTAKMIKVASANRDSKTAGPIARRVNDLVMPIFFRHFYERATAWLYADPDPTAPTPPRSPALPTEARP